MFWTPLMSCSSGGGDGGFHVRGAGADEHGGDLDHGGDDVGVLGDRKALEGHQAQEHDDDGDHHRHDWPVDEEPCHGSAPCPEALAAPSAAGAGSAGCPALGTTTMSGLIFVSPSKMTCSPEVTPASMTQRLPIFGPGFTGRICLVPRAHDPDLVGALGS